MQIFVVNLNALILINNLPEQSNLLLLLLLAEKSNTMNSSKLLTE